MQLTFLYRTFTLILLSALFLSCAEEANNVVQPGVTGAIPSEPRNLTAFSLDGSIALSWEAPQSNGGAYITGYNVYRKTSSADYEYIGSAGIATPQFLDVNMINGTEYFYKVSCVNEAGESGFSQETSAIPGETPSAPLNLSATPGNSKVTLSWQYPLYTGGFSVTGFKLYRYTHNSFDTVSISLGKQTSYIDTGLTNGVEYFYFIRAVNLKGEGASSNIIYSAPSLTSNDPDVLIYTDVKLRITFSEVPFSGLNIFTARATTQADASRDVQLEDTLINSIQQYFLQSAHLLKPAGFETGFYSSIVSVNMPETVFDTLSRIDSPNEILNESDFTLSSTAAYNNGGYFSNPLTANPVYAFYLKGKYHAGINKGKRVFGILRIDHIEEANMRTIFTLRIKINVAGKNRFY